jgi:hypothetical protein
MQPAHRMTPPPRVRHSNLNPKFRIYIVQAHPPTSPRKPSLTIATSGWCNKGEITMPSPEKFLRLALFIIAGLLSAVQSALGIGIFLWGSTLSHPDKQGVLLCLGPALSLPLFMTAFLSRRLHRWIMWLLACVSFWGAYAASLGAWSLRFWPVDLAIAIAVLVECSYQLERRVALSQPATCN